jgi:hypothetical protein
MTPTTEIITQERYYSSRLAATRDAEDFVNNPATFTNRQPKPQEWGLKAVVTKAECFNTTLVNGMVKLVLTISVTGDQKKIDRWNTEAGKLAGKPEKTTHTSQDPALRAQQEKSRAAQQKRLTGAKDK